jgi:hypothetical protein
MSTAQTWPSVVQCLIPTLTSLLVSLIEEAAETPPKDLYGDAYGCYLVRIDRRRRNRYSLATALYLLHQVDKQARDDISADARIPYLFFYVLQFYADQMIYLYDSIPRQLGLIGIGTEANLPAVEGLFDPGELMELNDDPVFNLHDIAIEFVSSIDERSVPFLPVDPHSLQPFEQLVPECAQLAIPDKVKQCLGLKKFIYAHAWDEFEAEKLVPCNCPKCTRFGYRMDDEVVDVTIMYNFINLYEHGDVLDKRLFLNRRNSKEFVKQEIHDFDAKDQFDGPERWLQFELSTPVNLVYWTRCCCTDSKTLWMEQTPLRIIGGMTFCSMECSADTMDELYLMVIKPYFLLIDQCEHDKLVRTFMRSSRRNGEPTPQHKLQACFERNKQFAKQIKRLKTLGTSEQHLKYVDNADLQLILWRIVESFNVDTGLVFAANCASANRLQNVTAAALNGNWRNLLLTHMFTTERVIYYLNNERPASEDSSLANLENLLITSDSMRNRFMARIKRDAVNVFDGIAA